MGFLRNLLNAAGLKTGAAIGNKLFPKSTDYVRLGDLGGNTKEAIREQRAADRQRIAAELLADKMRLVMDLEFKPSDMDHNLNVLTQLDSVIESLPSRLQRSYDERQLYKAALAKMKAGLVLCRSKDPSNAALAYFAEKYRDVS